MYQQLLDALKKKFTGVNDKILERIAKKLAKTTRTAEEVEPAVTGVTFQNIIDSESDRRANEATETAVKNYESQHKLKDGKPIKVTNGDGDEDDEEDDDDTTTTQPGAAATRGKKGGKKALSESDKILQQLLKGQQALADEINSMKQERIGNSRKQRFQELLKDADEKVRNRYMRDYDRLTFKDDDDYNSWLEDITPDIESDIAAIKAIGGITTPPRGGASARKEGEVDPMVTEYLKGQAERQDAYSGISGLPEAPAQP